jgi:TPR repeat protein
VSTPTLLSLLGRLGQPRLRALFTQAPHRAADWVHALAAQGVPQAQVCYGRLLLEGTGVTPNKGAALRWFERAAAQGDLDARNMVGRCHDNGWGTRVDPAAAAGHYAAAAAAGHSWAQYNLGHLYLEGRGVARDFSLACAWYRRAADQQHERAMNLVGRCCEEGWGTPCDLTAAAQWYRRSAESGYFRGQYNWATLLLSWGHGDEAVIWLERAALGGSFGVRRVIIDLLDRVGATHALFRLKLRLTRSSRLLVAARPNDLCGERTGTAA